MLGELVAISQSDFGDISRTCDIVDFVAHDRVSRDFTTQPVEALLNLGQRSAKACDLAFERIPAGLEGLADIAPPLCRFREIFAGIPAARWSIH
ncbi:hypothetical protein PTE30175_05161 [Pandoraea terrae]|uniref:Uncharacterized protein n=1 Tax=Pandoraea terrae TaxID=1537710 RepID=A0A5E4ZAA3_9BURK|nr:hypothetical protein PTE30175_05161 [Pandoraea terrae]